MANKKRQLVLWALWFCIICWVWATSYVYKDSIQNIFSPWYSSTYTLEEVNEKILALQKKSISEIEESYNNSILQSDSQRITWNMNIQIDANSSFGWWNGSIQLDNLDVQYSPKWLDMLITGLWITGETQIFEEKMSGKLELWTWHLIGSASWSYIKMSELAIDSQYLPQEIIPQEVIMTLNKLWESNKYVNLSENFLYSLIEAQMKSQWSEVQEFQRELLDFIKEKPLFVAYKQEDTKYYIAPSRDFCSFTLNVYTKASWIESYNCTDEQYKLITDNFLSSDYHNVQDFYIELNATKVHYVFDLIVDIPEENDELESKIEFWFEWVATLSKSESSKVYLNIKNQMVTWSGILIEQTNNTVNGYIDIDIPSYNFDSNVVITWTNDEVFINWDYSFESPEEISTRELQTLQWVKFNWTIEWKSTEKNYNFKITNWFSQAELWINWEAILDINWDIIDDLNTWNLVLSWELQMWNNASPVTWEIKADWNTQTNNQVAKWDINYSLDIPNIASGKYEIDYDFNISETIESNFSTPEDIIPQKNLNSLIKVNKAKVDAEKQAEEEKLLQWYKNGTIIPDTAGEKRRDTQRISDLRAIQIAIEQSYQDQARYPSYGEFIEMTSYYIEEIPSEVYPWYTKNSCEFWYTYSVADDGWIQNWKYRLASCLEDSENISLRSNNSADSWRDNYSFELGIDVASSDFNEVVLISDIVAGKYDTTHQFKENTPIVEPQVQSSYSSQVSYGRNPSQFLEEKNNAIKSDFIVRIQELYEIIETQMSNSLDIPFEVYFIPDGDIKIGNDVRIEVWDMDYTFLEMQLTWNQRQYWDLLVKDDYGQSVRAAAVYRNINWSYVLDSYELWWNRQDPYWDIVWTTIGTYTPSWELSKNSLFDYNFKAY